MTRAVGRYRPLRATLSSNIDHRILEPAARPGCDGPCCRTAEELLLIGGDDVGLEEGLFISWFAARVRVVESNSELKAPWLPQETIRGQPQFTVHNDTEVIGSQGQDRLEAVPVRDRSTGQEYS